MCFFFSGSAPSVNRKKPTGRSEDAQCVNEWLNLDVRMEAEQSKGRGLSLSFDLDFAESTCP